MLTARYLFTTRLRLADRQRSSCGTSLLEFSLVTPFLLIIVIGAVDIGNLLRSYAALQEGVRGSLRCVVPTDGQCVGAGGTPPVPRYEVLASNTATRFFGQEFTYAADASWLNLPIYSIPMKASVLQTVLFEVAQRENFVRKNYYPALGLADFVLRTATFPYITGDPLAPDFFYTSAGAEHYPPALRLSLPVSGRTSRQDGVNIGAFDFTLPRPASARGPCFVSSAHNQGSAAVHNTDFTRQCADSWPWPNGNPTGTEELNDFSYVVIHISGNADGAQGAQGSVSLSLTQPGRDRSDLGGRLFTSNGSGNFVPRGAPIGRIDPEIRDDYSEFTIYQAIKVYYDVPATLHFRLQSENGLPVSWDGGTFRLFTAQYEPRPNEAFECRGGVAPGDIARGVNCDIAQPLTVHTVVRNGSSPLRSEAALSLGCQSAQSDPVINLAVADPDNYELASSPGGSSLICPALHLEQRCPEASSNGAESVPGNFGVVEAAGQDGFVRESSEALSTCPPKSETEEVLNAAQNVRWKEAIIAVGTVSWTKENCSDTPNSADDAGAFSPYRKLHFGSPQLASASPLYTGTAEPEAFRASNPEYQCTEISLASRHVDGQTQSVPTTSLFSGRRPDLGCAWENKLAQDAAQNGLLPQGAYTKFSRSYAGELVLNSQPVDACSIYRVSLTPEGTERSLGIFTSDELPAQCSDPGTYCRKVVLGFTPGNGENSEPSINTEYAAYNVGFPYVSSAVPDARWRCRGDYCTDIRLEHDSSTDFVSASGTIQVPVGFLLGNAFTMSYSRRERREVHYAN